MQEKKEESNADGKVPKPEEEIKVDGREQEEEELRSRAPSSWDQPRRSVNH